ncbi:hypothetical protein AC578_1021 [Pseudocercospora eumusae]|uniref:Uncharacterized protein n=1 Tax=Pseudocercospora eumusae TaxID=321146 RepID=A0A139HTL8_9PEZI|nr:hypothetical protein AC578_1021 [Pseudocercospora eumusae]
MRTRRQKTVNPEAAVESPTTQVGSLQTNQVGSPALTKSDPQHDSEHRQTSPTDESAPAQHNITEHPPPILRQDFVNDLFTRSIDMNSTLFAQQINEGNFPLAMALDMLFGHMYGEHWALRRRLVLRMFES